MKVEPEIELPEREPMRPRTNTLSDELERRVRRELARRRKTRKTPTHRNAENCAPWGD